MSSGFAINVIRGAIEAEWPEAVAELSLDAESVFLRSDGRIIVSLEYGDAASFLFADQGFGADFIDRQVRLGEIVAEEIPGAFFEMETAGALYLVA